MVKECMVILTNMTEAQSKTLAANMKLSEQDTLKNQLTKSRCKTNINKTTECVTDSSLSESSVVNIDGIMLPLYDRDNVHSDNLVPVKSTVNNLRSLALAVASGEIFSFILSLNFSLRTRGLKR